MNGCIRAALGAALLFVGVGKGAAAADMPCAPRTVVLKELGERFGEAPIAKAITDAGAEVELLASESGETWTFIVTTPSGMSCLFSGGTGWESVPFVAPVRGKGT